MAFFWFINRHVFLLVNIHFLSARSKENNNLWATWFWMLKSLRSFEKWISSIGKICHWRLEINLLTNLTIFNSKLVKLRMPIYLLWTSRKKSNSTYVLGFSTMYHYPIKFSSIGHWSKLKPARHLNPVVSLLFSFQNHYSNLQFSSVWIQGLHLQGYLLASQGPFYTVILFLLKDEEVEEDLSSRGPQLLSLPLLDSLDQNRGVYFLGLWGFFWDLSRVLSVFL